MADAIEVLAEHLLKLSHAYQGKNAAKIMLALEQPLPALTEIAEELQDKIPLTETQKKLAHSSVNGRLLTLALTSLMNGTRITRAEHDVITHFYALYQWPHDLRAYASGIIDLVKLYGNPEQIIEEFSRLYAATALPVLKQRLSGFGVSSADIQGILKERPDINPVLPVWLLAGAIAPMEWVNGETQLSPEATAFAHAILGENPAVLAYGPQTPRNDLALRALLGVDALPNKKLVIDMHMPPNSSTVNFLTHTSHLPANLNAQFDDDRISNAEQMLRQNGMGKLQLKLSTPAKRRTFQRDLGAGLAELLPSDFAGPADADREQTLLAAISHKPAASTQTAGQKILPVAQSSMAASVPNSRLREYTFNFYFVNSDLLARIEKERQSASKYTWSAVPEFLRRKIEAAGYSDAEQIADVISKLPGQRGLLENPIVFIYRHFERGAVVSGRDVIEALMQPEKARYAGGMMVDLFYDTIKNLIAPAEDIDTFYGLDKREPKTLEEVLIADIVEKIDRVMREDLLLKFTVTEQQRATILQLHAREFMGLLNNPLEAYDKSGQPTRALIAMQERFGFTLSKEDCEIIRQEREQKAAMAAAEERRQRLERRHQANQGNGHAPTIILDPWREIPRAYKELCNRKGFVEFDALANEVAWDIEAHIKRKGSTERARDVTRHVRLAIQTLPNAFAPLRGRDGMMGDRPVSIMHAHVSFILHPDGIELAALQNGWKYASADRNEVHVNIVDAVFSNPRLAHIVSWQQLAEKGADAVKLTEQLANAYRLVNPREGRLAPMPVLQNILNTLNAGRTQEPLTPSSIVSPDIWRRAYQEKTGRAVIDVTALRIDGEANYKNSPVPRP